MQKTFRKFAGLRNRIYFCSPKNRKPLRQRCLQWVAVDDGTLRTSPVCIGHDVNNDKGLTGFDSG